MIKTKVIKVNPDRPEPERIKEAADILKKGGIVAFPTETVYGLGAACDNSGAVTKVYEVKNRPKSKPLTIHVADMESLEGFSCEIPHLAKILMEKFWPGPLTIILNTKDRKKTLAFRMPANEIAKALIKKTGTPLLAPSANISGGKAPVNAKEVLDGLEGKIDGVIDGGQTHFSKESTIIDITTFPYRVLREGAISKGRIKDVWSHSA